MPVLGKHRALGLDLHFVLVESKVNPLELDLLLLVGLNLEANFEISHRTLNGEFFCLLLTGMHDLTLAAQSNVI